MPTSIICYGTHIKALLTLPNYSHLNDAELRWVSRQSFLESKGYILRQRFRPGWTPSWTLPENEGVDPTSFEDHVALAVRPLLSPSFISHIKLQPKSRTIDAAQISDGRLVCIKCVKTVTHKMETRWTDGLEIRMAVRCREEPGASDIRNHCVPARSSAQLSFL